MQAITWIAAYAIMPLVTFGAFSLSKTHRRPFLDFTGSNHPSSLSACAAVLFLNIRRATWRVVLSDGGVVQDVCEQMQLTRTRICPRNKPFQTFFSFHPARSSYRKVGSSSATNCQSAPPFLKFAMILELVSCCRNEAEDTAHLSGSFSNASKCFRGIRKRAVRMFSRPRFSFGRERGIVYPRLDIWDGST